MKIDFWKAFAVMALLAFMVFGYYYIQVNKYEHTQYKDGGVVLFFRTNKISGITDGKGLTFRGLKMTNWRILRPE